jgi:hypothetical protein
MMSCGWQACELLFGSCLPVLAVLKRGKLSGEKIGKFLDDIMP